MEPSLFNPRSPISSSFTISQPWKLSARHLLFPLFGQRLRDLECQGAETELVRYDLQQVRTSMIMRGQWYCDRHSPRILKESGTDGYGGLDDIAELKWLRTRCLIKSVQLRMEKYDELDEYVIYHIRCRTVCICNTFSSTGRFHMVSHYGKSPDRVVCILISICYGRWWRCTSWLTGWTPTGMIKSHPGSWTAQISAAPLANMVSWTRWIILSLFM